MAGPAAGAAGIRGNDREIGGITTMPVFLIEVRFVRLLLFVLFVGAALDAHRGDVRGMVVATVCAAVLWWRPASAIGWFVADVAGWMRWRFGR